MGFSDVDFGWYTPKVRQSTTIYWALPGSRVWGAALDNASSQQGVKPKLIVKPEALINRNIRNGYLSLTQ